MVRQITAPSCALLITAALASGCGEPETSVPRDTATPLDAVVEDAFRFAQERLDAVADEIRAAHPDDFASFYPGSTETRGEALGRWKLTSADDWRSGFFPGALWQVYRRTGDAA